jgi:hypothetical protein
MALKQRARGTTRKATALTALLQLKPGATPVTGNSEGYYTRQETRGDGAVRTISYWNPTAVYMRYNGTGYQQVVGGGQTLVDHFTDYTNDLTKAERHEYGWGQTQFQTPIKITDALQNVTFTNLGARAGAPDQANPSNGQ